MSDEPGSAGEWDGYVERFHTARPGATESLLALSVDNDGRTAYDWVSEDLPNGLAVDVGCGSGPTQPLVTGWVGVDRSRAELDVARSHGRVPLVAASATALPFRDRSVDAAMATMSLMVIDNPAVAVAELARVLRSGGTLRVLLPAQRPLTVADRARYGLLLAVLGRRSFPFPRPEVSADVGPLLAAAGFEVVADESRRFCFAITGRDDSDLFIDSLYLPNVGARRVRFARALVRSWGHGEIGIPLRRVTAHLTRTAGHGAALGWAGRTSTPSVS